jgi:hypothetical protein
MPKFSCVRWHGHKLLPLLACILQWSFALQDFKIQKKFHWQIWIWIFIGSFFFIYSGNATSVNYPFSLSIKSSSLSLKKFPSFQICCEFVNMNANLPQLDSYHVPQYWLFLHNIGACENNCNIVFTQILSQHLFTCAACILEKWILHLVHDINKVTFTQTPLLLIVGGATRVNMIKPTIFTLFFTMIFTIFF